LLPDRAVAHRAGPLQREAHVPARVVPPHAAPLQLGRGRRHAAARALRAARRRLPERGALARGLLPRPPRGVGRPVPLLPVVRAGRRGEVPMRRIRYAVAMSLDGYIAGPKGEADWIVMDPEMDFGALFERFDTFLMGRRTFEPMARVKRATTPGVTTFVVSKT